MLTRALSNPKITLTSLTRLLYRCYSEELDDTAGKSSVYNVPGWVSGFPLRLRWICYWRERSDVRKLFGVECTWGMGRCVQHLPSQVQGVLPFRLLCLPSSPPPFAPSAPSDTVTWPGRALPEWSSCFVTCAGSTTWATHCCKTFERYVSGGGVGVGWLPRRLGMVVTFAAWASGGCVVCAGSLVDGVPQCTHCVVR